jgi:hypothetical protein
MRVNSEMRRLLYNAEAQDIHVVLPGELRELLTTGWREARGGALLLAAPDEFLNHGRDVPAAELGGFEYRNNDFGIPCEDLVRAVPEFAPRLTSEDWEDRAGIDYHTPDGRYAGPVQEFLASMACRAVTFAARALALAVDQLPGTADMLTAIVSTGIEGDILVHGTTVKFTTARGTPSGCFDIHWFDDLESFKLEAMAVLTKGDASSS